MIPRKVLTLLVTLAVVLPIVLVVIVGVAWLLENMNDPDATPLVLRSIALCFGILWVVGLISLLVALGINSVSNPQDPSRRTKDE